MSGFCLFFDAVARTFRVDRRLDTVIPVFVRGPRAALKTLGIFPVFVASGADAAGFEGIP